MQLKMISRYSDIIKKTSSFQSKENQCIVKRKKKKKNRKRVRKLWAANKQLFVYISL